MLTYHARVHDETNTKDDGIMDHSSNVLCLNCRKPIDMLGSEILFFQKLLLFQTYAERLNVNQSSKMTSWWDFSQDDLPFCEKCLNLVDKLRQLALEEELLMRGIRKIVNEFKVMILTSQGTRSSSSFNDYRDQKFRELAVLDLSPVLKLPKMDQDLGNLFSGEPELNDLNYDLDQSPSVVEEPLTNDEIIQDNHMFDALPEATDHKLQNVDESSTDQVAQITENEVVILTENQQRNQLDELLKRQQTRRLALLKSNSERRMHITSRKIATTQYPMKVEQDGKYSVGGILLFKDENSKEWTCGQCNHKLKIKWNMVWHIRTHFGIKTPWGHRQQRKDNSDIENPKVKKRKHQDTDRSMEAEAEDTEISKVSERSMEAEDTEISKVSERSMEAEDTAISKVSKKRRKDSKKRRKESKKGTTNPKRKLGKPLSRDPSSVTIISKRTAKHLTRTDDGRMFISEIEMIRLKSRNFQCGQCKTILGTPNSLARHIEMAHLVHLVHPRRISEIANRKSATSQYPLKLEQDGKYSVGGISLFKDKDSNNWTCGQCNHKLKTKWNMVWHIRTHFGIKIPWHRGEQKDPEAPFVRPLLDKWAEEQSTKFTMTKRKYYEGVEVIPLDEGKRFKCGACDGIYASRGGLSNHIRAKHLSEDKWLKCEVCNKGFPSLVQLQVHHQSWHSTDRVYTCSICGLSMKTRSTLYDHTKRVHESKKNDQCEICGKEFYSRKDCKKHRQTHKSSSS